jgi:hypothetical protein
MRHVCWERRKPRGSAWDTPAIRYIKPVGNKDVGARLFISPRTVQSHLTHVYAKLGLTSRVRLVKEAGRHA